MLLLSFAGVCTAQTPPGTGRLVHGTAVYRFKHIRDTANPSAPYTEDMQLFFTQQVSRYTSLTKMNAQAARARAMEAGASSGMVNLGKLSPYTSEDIYFFPEDKMLVKTRSYMRVNYKIPDTAFVINWTILNETKKIEGYDCQQATCLFKGRSYTAWFAPLIAVSYGPWKLNGLPGLILEATDATGQVSFTLAGLNFNEVPQKDVALPESSVATTEKQLTNMIEYYKNNPEEYGKATGVNLQFTNQDGRTLKPTYKKNKNPVELE